MQNSVHSAKNISRLKNVPSDLDYTKLIVLPFTKNFNLFDVTQFQQSRCDLRDIVRLIRSRVGIKIKKTRQYTRLCYFYQKRNSFEIIPGLTRVHNTRHCRKYTPSYHHVTVKRVFAPEVTFSSNVLILTNPGNPI